MVAQPLSPKGLTFPSAWSQANPAETAGPWGFLEFFVISQTAFPAILFLPGMQVFRLPVRVSSYAIGLLALVWWGRQLKKVAAHPSQMVLLLVLLWLVAMIFHPTTNTTLAGVAQVGLYLAIMSPIFWSPGLVNGPKQLERLLALLLICNGINSLVGVLQVYDPQTWMPAEFSIVQRATKFGLGSVSYLNDQGQWVVRPPGLFDTPGAVCGPGMIAVLLGLVFFLNSRRPWQRWGALALSGIGLAAIYLSQVRSALLIGGGMVAVYVAALFFLQKDRVRVGKIIALSVLLAVLALPIAVRLAGRSVQSRVATLTAKDPVSVYYEARRGKMVEQAFITLLPLYPMGAGLGRWGMMRLYFGDEFNTDSALIWAEVQWPAWILDGGFVLVLLYSLALTSTVYYEFRIVGKEDDTDLKAWGPAILAANCGTLALCFSFTPFTAPIGMQYWFLAGVLHGAVQARIRAKSQ